MKALIVLLLVIAIAAGVYVMFIKDSAAYETYKNFATAVARGEHDRALRFAKDVAVLGSGDELRGQSVGGVPVDALVALRYARESETKNADGTITIHAIQSIRFDPPGTTSAMGAMIAKYRQAAALEKVRGRWLVTSLKSEFMEMRNWKGELQ